MAPLRDAAAAGPVIASRALVTGAAGAVGGAIAARLVEEGAQVIRTDVVGGGPIVRADVSEPGDVERLCQHTIEQLGGVDILVNAAGIYGERVPFTRTDPETWWRVLGTNVRGPALLCHRILPGMVARGHGLVVNINSKASVWDDPGQSSVAYSTSKAALARFTGALAAEVAGTGVLVVDLSPGMVRSAMVASRPDFAEIPDHWFLPADVVAEKVVALAAGGYEDLHGHFLHATDDLDDLLARIRRRPRTRTLSLDPYGPDDPVS